MSSDISNVDLIKLATEVIQSKQISDCQVGQVGCALITDKGSIFRGVCLDTGSGLGFCAERTAIFKAVSEGCRGFQAIAIASDAQQPTAPCGVCRQVLAEFCSPDFVVLMSDRDGRYDKKTLGDLLPEAFGSSFLSTGTDL